MCGIAYCRTTDGLEANVDIRRIYFNQKGRGSDGYGFVAISNTAKHFRSKYEHEILHDLKVNVCTEILWHHRNPTSTHNTENTAHPLCSNDNFLKHKYYLAHNGSIPNSKLLYSRHSTDGIKYSSIVGLDTYNVPIFNDSEALLFELALVIEGKKDKKDFAAFGSMAFIMLQTDKNDKPLNLYFGRNVGSPLKVKATESKLIIASDIDGEEIAENKLHKVSYADNSHTIEDMTFPRYYNDKDGASAIETYHHGRMEDRYSGSPNLLENPRRVPFTMMPIKEDARVRSSIIERTYTPESNFRTDLDDDEGDSNVLLSLTDDELLARQQGFMADMEVAETAMIGEHQAEELSRLRGEKREIKKSLDMVDAEINKRIKINDKILIPNKYEHLPHA